MINYYTVSVFQGNRDFHVKKGICMYIYKSDFFHYIYMKKSIFCYNKIDYFMLIMLTLTVFCCCK